MIGKSVQPGSRADKFRPHPCHHGRRRGEVNQKGKRPIVSCGHLKRAMEALRVHGVSIHELHESIEHVGGSMGLWEIDMCQPSFSLVIKLYDIILHGAIGKMVTGPFIQASQALAHLPFTLGSVDVPDLIRGRLKRGGKRFGGPIVGPAVAAHVRGHKKNRTR